MPLRWREVPMPKFLACRFQGVASLPATLNHRSYLRLLLESFEKQHRLLASLGPLVAAVYCVDVEDDEVQQEKTSGHHFLFKKPLDDSV